MFALIARASLACAEVERLTEALIPDPTSNGCLHLFGMHVPAVVVVMLTVPVVWLACRIIHRSQR
jgi:hypothetical protein